MIDKGRRNRMDTDAVLEFAGLQYRVINADNLCCLPTLDAESVDMVVTSPPYFAQREYDGVGVGNEDTVHEYIDHIIHAFTQVLRVVKPTGNIVYNMGDKIHNGGLQLIPYRFATRVLDEFGLRLVNDITWLKRNPTPHQFNRRLTFSTEPFFHFAKGGQYYYDRQAFQPNDDKLGSKPSSKLGHNYRQLIEHSDLTEAERSVALAALNDVIEEVFAETIKGFRMKIRGVHAPAYGGQDGGRKKRIDQDGFDIIRITWAAMKRDVIESPVANVRWNEHPAMFPVQVIQELIRLLCPPGGIVLDPYVGSGSTMVASVLENRHCIGIDISSDYCLAAKERVADCIRVARSNGIQQTLW